MRAVRRQDGEPTLLPTRGGVAVWLRRGTEQRAQDRIRQHRASVPRGGAGGARAEEAGEGVPAARPGTAEARQASEGSPDAAGEGRYDDGRKRSPGERGR